MMEKRNGPKRDFKFPRKSNIHVVSARGKWYFFHQAGRNSEHEGPRTRLPNDPHSAEFWTAARQAQGITGAIRTDTVNAMIDAFITAWPTLPKKLAKGTQYNYTRSLKLARTMWGELPAMGLKPSNIKKAMEKLVERPGIASMLLTAMRALSKWALLKELIACPLCHGVERYESEGGHVPWTPEQQQAAHDYLTGRVRRGVLIELYTGQRGSDMVRMGPTMIDPDGDGFDLGIRGQVKTGVRPWCPILDELAEEMKTWDDCFVDGVLTKPKRLGPFILNDNGKPCTNKKFEEYFRKAKKELAAKGITILEGTTLHGLRGTACVNLKRYGLSDGVIADVVGLSVKMVERYTRFEDKRAGGKAALIRIADHKAKRAAGGTK